MNGSLNIFLVFFTTFVGYINSNLRFVAVGNFGFGEDAAIVANAIKQNENPSFFVSPGSNFQGGLVDKNDEKFTKYFLDVYEDSKGMTKVPFFTVLGIEDWTGNPTAEIRTIEQKSELPKLKEIMDVNYSDGEKSLTSDFVKRDAPIWFAPNWWYHWVQHFTVPTGTALLGSSHNDLSVGIFMLDTFVIKDSFPYQKITEQAKEDLLTFMKNGMKIFDYIVVVGDAPIHKVSGAANGSLRNFLDPIFAEAQVDLYIAAGDLIMESVHVDETLHIQCGTSSKSTFMNRKLYKRESAGDEKFVSGELGYCSIELDNEQIKVKFVKEDGTILHTVSTFKKIRKERDVTSPYTYFAKLPKVTYYPLPSEHVAMGDGLLFVQVVGTIGLMLGAILFFLLMASAFTKPKM